MNEEEKNKFLNSRRNKKKAKLVIFKEPAPLPPTILPKSCISYAEMEEVKKYVIYSGYFDVTKVKDMEHELIRELIRYASLSWISFLPTLFPV